MESQSKLEQIQSVKKRLGEGALSPDDVTLLNDLLTRAEEGVQVSESATESIGDRKIIARLPHGMDIVK